MRTHAGRRSIDWTDLRQSRLDRDEGAGEGPHAALRDGQWSRRGSQAALESRTYMDWPSPLLRSSDTRPDLELLSP